MTDTSPQTAVLIFTRPAQAEAAIKNFTFGAPKTNFRIATSLIKHTIATVRQTKIPYFISSGAEFGETNFHGKLTAAVSNLFAQGVENLIIIGNDCPAITPALILQTQVRLETNNLVLGPASDGGVYLIGLTKDAFNPDAFAELPWQTDRVFTGFQDYGQQLAIGISLLPVFQDIDSADDLQQGLHHLCSVFKLVHRLKSLLASVKQQIRFSNCTLFNLFLSQHIPSRAPPVY